MKAYRITYDCTLPDDGRVTFLLAALDKLVVASGGEPGANPEGVRVHDERPEPKASTRGGFLRSIDGGGA